MTFGIWEIAVILLLVLVFFGAGKLPAAMGDLAKGIKSFKSGMKVGPETAEAPPPAPVEPRPTGPLLLEQPARTEEPPRA